MASGLLTPLQLIAGASLINNGGISVGTDLSQAIAGYTQTPVITAWQAAVNYYVGQPWSSPGVLADLLSIGASVCAALGNSIPAGAPTPRPVTGPVDTGFSGLVVATANLYLGNGDVGKFSQAFFAAQGYCGTTNLFVNSAANAQNYLGPTFKGMDALTTNSISSVNTNFTAFGVDLGRQGQLTNFADLNNYGTPAALLRQLAKVADLQGGTLKIVETPLLAAGLTRANIQTLLTADRADNPTQFDRYQALAYEGMMNVKGADLQQVLNILGVTTRGLQSMADLLNPQKIFPNSWPTMTTTTPTGVVPVYQSNGSIAPELGPAVSVYLPTPSGCDELGKIIPPEIAVANKAIQVSLQQMTGAPLTTLPALAQTVLGQTQYIWNETQPYLENTVVNNGDNIPTFYRAQQDVPAGTDINNTAYWKPTGLGGMSTMAGLPDIQAQTKALPDDVAAFYQTLAIGSGPNGTITVCDILGAAPGYGYTDQFASVTANINRLSAAGALTALTATYTAMLGAADDAAMSVLITQANANIATIAAGNAATVAAINTSWSSMATKLNTEYTLQTRADIVWTDLQANNQPSVFALVQSLPSAGLEVDAGGAGWYFEQIANQSTRGGQAMVGVLREARNTQRLNAAQLSLDTTPSTRPAVTPSPVIKPVY